MKSLASVLGLIPGTLRFLRGRPATRVACLLAGVLGIFSNGCTRSEPKADFVIINGAEPGTLDPALVTVQADARIVRALFDGLTRLDPRTASAVPGSGGALGDIA